MVWLWCEAEISWELQNCSPLQATQKFGISKPLGLKGGLSSFVHVLVRTDQLGLGVEGGEFPPEFDHLLGGRMLML